MRKLLYGFLDLIFPPRCCFCQKFLKRGERKVCAVCEAALPRTGRDAVTDCGGFFSTAPLYYEGTVKKAFHRFKFYGATHYAKIFGGIMANHFKEAPENGFDLITWAPVSKKRRKERGYDQAQLLAYAVALELGDVAVSTLMKIKDTPPQSKLEGARARRENVRGAYAAESPELVAMKRVLLIDDILTTSSTLTECAEILKSAGAAEVTCLVLAKSRPPEHKGKSEK